MELIQPPFILKKHFEQASPPLQHLIEPVVQPNLDGALHLLFLFVLGVPDVVGDELLNFGGLLWGEICFPEPVEGLEETRHILDQDIISSDHYL